ncbi:MAG TPA: DUF3817 domain-containing protein [Polyangiaceae bacterium]
MSAINTLRLYALLEGSSLLLLLFVAMPLKYLAGLPLAVRIVGGVHGLLFLLFVSALVRAASERGWPLRKSLLALAAAFVPGATFVLDRALRRELDSAHP